MSYVRFGPDSEVYAWHDGEKITCIVSYELQERFPDEIFSDEGELFRHLLYLRDNGVDVPNYAIANTVLENAEHKLLKNMKIPFFTKKKLFRSTSESIDVLCPEVKEEDEKETNDNSQYPGFDFGLDIDGGD